MDSLFDLFQSIKQKLKNLRRIEAYFTLQGHPHKEHQSLHLSYLPPFQILLKELPKKRFDQKYLIFYFGLHSQLTPDLFEKAKLPLETLQIQKRPLYYLRCTTENLKKLSHLNLKYKDWWCLTSTEKPDTGVLKERGVVSGPAAFSSRHAHLHKEILINYFTDPSFHGLEEDIKFFVQRIFESGFRRLYPKKPRDYPPLKKLKPLAQLQLELKPFKEGQKRIRLMRNFILTAGDRPRIIRVDWPGGKRQQICWDGYEWGPLKPVEKPRLRPSIDLGMKYLIPILLIPLALIVIPFTLFLWFLIAFYEWLKKFNEEDANQ